MIPVLFLAEQQQLHPGDAIVAINDKVVEHWKHDDVVAELRSCGPDVSLTVRAFDGASRILSSAGSKCIDFHENFICYDNKCVWNTLV